jgi:hypothetical protein
MTLSIDVGCIDARGRLAWGVLGLGGLGTSAVPGPASVNAQPTFDPASELGAPSYLYQQGNRQVRGISTGHAATTHAVVSPTLNTGDDIRSAAHDRIYAEALVVQDRGAQAIKFGMALTSIGVVEIGTVVGSIGLGQGGSRGLDGVNVAFFNAVDGSLIMLAVDFPNELVWYGGNGIWNNGDPATATGGAAINAAWTAAGAVMSLRATAAESAIDFGIWRLPALPAFKPAGFALWPNA